MTKQAALEARGVSMDFGGVRAVDGMTFDLHDGAFLGVLGQNGSGKTTLINLITGVYRPTLGHIRVFGRDIAGLSMSEISRLGVARTFQNLRLFEGLTGLENVLVGASGRHNVGFWKSAIPSPGCRRLMGENIDRACEAIQLLGIAHCRSIKAQNLPHGDRRRLEIARALVSEPSLLVLDEPSAGLTRDEASALVGALAALRRTGLSVLLIEHNLGVVKQLTDQVLVMHSGRLIAKGVLHDVLSESAVRSLYMGYPDA
jgi:ABC-type branched-subunit amino acid transport system ATPase component